MSPASSAPAPERPRAAHLGPERRRPLVLDAAMDVFLERGYEGTSMEAIAQAAGVSKPVVYDCFASKEELFKALFRREESRVLREVAATLPSAAPDGPEAALLEGMTAFLRAVTEKPQAYRTIVLGEGGMSAAVARRIQLGRERQIADAMIAARHWLDPEHRLDDSSARLFAQILVGIGEAGARMLLGGDDDWTPETLAPQLARAAATALPG